MKTIVKGGAAGLLAAGVLTGTLIFGKYSGEALGHQQGLEQGTTQEERTCIETLRQQRIGSFVLTASQLEAAIQNPAAPRYLSSGLLNALNRAAPEDITIMGIGFAPHSPSDDHEINNENSVLTTDMQIVGDEVRLYRGGRPADAYDSQLSLKGDSTASPGEAIVTVSTLTC